MPTYWLVATGDIETADRVEVSERALRHCRYIKSQIDVCPDGDGMWQLGFKLDSKTAAFPIDIEQLKFIRDFLELHSEDERELEDDEVGSFRENTEWEKEHLAPFHGLRALGLCLSAHFLQNNLLKSACVRHVSASVEDKSAKGISEYFGVPSREYTAEEQAKTKERFPQAWP